MEKVIGFIGLGRMGKNIILHLLEQGINVVAANRTYSVAEEFFTEFELENTSNKYPGKLQIVKSYKEIIDILPSPRNIILMVKAGEAVDAVISELVSEGAISGDTIIDGGNSYFEDTKRRFEELHTKGIEYIDSGTSGGIEGARYGACLMLGGNRDAVESLSWLWDAISSRSPNAQTGVQGGGWSYFGPTGAGHYVKMVHNGVEYGMNQAIGEGFQLLAEGEYSLDLEKVALNWGKGSVVRGWLIDLLAKELGQDANLDSYSGIVQGGETGAWTIQTAQKKGISQSILEAAIQARKNSLTQPTFATKVVSALRAGYGGHKEKKV